MQEEAPDEALARLRDAFDVTPAARRLDRLDVESDAFVEPPEILHLVAEVVGDPGDGRQGSSAPRELEPLLEERDRGRRWIAAVETGRRDVDIAPEQQRPITGGRGHLEALLEKRDPFVDMAGLGPGETEIVKRPSQGGVGGTRPCVSDGSLEDRRGI